MRWRFVGDIAGCGSSSGVRLVVGRWTSSPLGAFADVMLEQSDGHRVLLAPQGPPLEFIAANYGFDEVRASDVTVEVGPASWLVQADALEVELTIGARPALGHLLRAIPGSIAGAPWFAAALDPLAARLLAGVRTRGRSRSGARQWYAARDLRRLVAVRGTWRDADLGELAPVSPPVRFGFASTPVQPGLTTVTTTLDMTSSSG